MASRNALEAEVARLQARAEELERLRNLACAIAHDAEKERDAARTRAEAAESRVKELWGLLEKERTEAAELREKLALALELAIEATVQLDPHLRAKWRMDERIRDLGGQITESEEVQRERARFERLRGKLENSKTWR